MSRIYELGEKSTRYSLKKRNLRRRGGVIGSIVLSFVYRDDYKS